MHSAGMGYGQPSRLGSNSNPISATHRNMPVYQNQQQYGMPQYGMPQYSMPHAHGHTHAHKQASSRHARLVPILPWSPHDIVIEEIEIDDDGKEVGRQMTLVTAPNQRHRKKANEGGVSEEAFAMYKQEIEELVRARERGFENERKEERGRKEKLEEELIRLQVEEEIRKRGYGSKRNSDVPIESSSSLSMSSNYRLSKLGMTGKSALEGDSKTLKLSNTTQKARDNKSRSYSQNNDFDSLSNLSKNNVSKGSKQNEEEHPNQLLPVPIRNTPNDLSRGSFSENKNNGGLNDNQNADIMQKGSKSKPPSEIGSKIDKSKSNNTNPKSRS